MSSVRERGSGALGTGALIAIIAAFVVVGAPMVYYLWTTINELLAGQVDGGQLGIAAIVLLFFAGVLVILSRSVRRLDERAD